MAGPEGFDPSLIETEALLKKMKPRPANLSAARIVYEAGRAVGKEEMQAQLASGGFVLAGAPLSASSWKKWILPAWAGGATAVCLLLWLQFASPPPRTPEHSDYSVHPTTYPASQGVPAIATESHPSQGYGAGAAAQWAEKTSQPLPPVSDEKLITPGPQLHKSSATAASESGNQSGTPRDGRDLAPPQKREQNLADYIREQLPIFESRRNIDPIEIRDGVLQPPQSGMVLTTLGMIKTP